MAHTISSPTHPQSPTGFGPSIEEPTVALRPRPGIGLAPIQHQPSQRMGPQRWGHGATAPVNHYAGPRPGAAPYNSAPWGNPNAWGSPPPWAMPPAGGARRKTQHWLLAATGAVVAVAAVTIAVAASTGKDNGSATASHGVPVPNPPTKSAAAPTPPPPPPPSLVSDATLPTLLPDPAQVAQVMGTTVMDPIDKLSGPGMYTDNADPAQCVGLVIPAAKNAYAGSGWRATYVQALHDQSNRVFDGVTTFPAASSAGNFVTQQELAWQGCRFAPVVLGPEHDKPITWTIQDVSRQGDTVTARISAQGGLSCQRALTSKSNVVIDVSACSAHPSDEAVTLASAISQRVQ